MKKIILLLAFIAMMTSCSNSEQIDALKAELIKDYGKSQEEVDSYSYSVHDADAKEVHSALSDKYIKMGEFAMDVDNLKEAEESLQKIDSLEAAMPKDKNKKYNAVHAYKIRDNDTIFNVYYYMEGNKLVAIKSKK